MKMKFAALGLACIAAFGIVATTATDATAKDSSWGCGGAC